jgi:hypothetical protein
MPSSLSRSRCSRGQRRRDECPGGHGGGASLLRKGGCAMALHREVLSLEQLEHQRGRDRSWAAGQRDLADPEVRAYLEASIRRLNEALPGPVLTCESSWRRPSSPTSRGLRDVGEFHARVERESPSVAAQRTARALLAEIRMSHDGRRACPSTFCRTSRSTRCATPRSRSTTRSVSCACGAGTSTPRTPPTTSPSATADAPSPGCSLLRPSDRGARSRS